MSFDRKAAKHAFRDAVLKLGRGDPFPLARVLRLAPVGAPHSIEGRDETKYQKVILVENGTDWSSVLNCWLDACEAANQGEALECYDKQAALHALFNQIFTASTGNVLVPSLLAVCRSTHRTAVVADQEVASRDNAKLNNAVVLLQESYAKTFNDRKEFRPNTSYDEAGSKKAGVLAIVNELFRIYFRLNTLRLCKNLAKPVEARKLHETGSMGQMVTYRYFIGRLSLFEDNYAEAEANLEYALSNCHASAIHNKRCILRYLVPVKLYRGKLPTSEMLKKYGLDEFVLLVDGIRKGDLKTFNSSLLEYQHRFIRQGTYLLLERCKTVCYRSLFKRIHGILDKHQIHLVFVIAAFKWLDIPIDTDEVECILANLIYRGVIRGYLSHSKRCLVLSKRDPFPTKAMNPGAVR